MQMEGVETPRKTEVQILRELCEVQMLQDQINGTNVTRSNQMDFIGASR